MRIDRCSCQNRTFKELEEIADRHGARDLESLQRHVRFGDNCRLCHVYVREMLATGKVVFHQIIPDPE